jgi:hypothetical protein
VKLKKQGCQSGGNDNDTAMRSFVIIAFLLAVVAVSTPPALAFNADAGPLIDAFPLTMVPGQRTEILGPLFYAQTTQDQRSWAIPPLFSHTENPDPDIHSEEYDFVYPVLTYSRFGKQYRWQFFQLLSFSGGYTQTETNRDRFTIFPVFFQQRSSDPAENYTAVFPIYGRMLSRLYRDEVFFVAFPLYSKTRKKDVVTVNYLYPFFHTRTGDGLRGWQFFPLVGHEAKEITIRTNRFGDAETVAGHDNFFALWPIYYHNTFGVGTTNAGSEYGALPAYAAYRSPTRDTTTILWPFFSMIDDRERGYHEYQGPWPFVVVARGTGKNTTRFWPLYAHAEGKSNSLETLSILGPVYRYGRMTSSPLHRERRQVLYFLFSDVSETNMETQAKRTRRDFWPFFTARKDWDGSTRLQVLAVFEPLIPTNKSIERNWSPVWSLWRDEKNAATGATSQSLLWNLYRTEQSPDSKKCSLLFGLFQYQKGAEGKRVRLFYVPLGKGSPGVKQ